MNAVMTSGRHDQPAPATSDIEQAFSRFEAKLAADVIELLSLRTVQVVIRRVEIRAGVHHRRIEPQLVEVVRNIVMKADGALIARFRMSQPMQLRERLGFVRVSGKAEQQRSKAQFFCRAEMFFQKVFGYRKYGENVAGKVKVVVNVSFATGDLAVGA